MSYAPADGTWEKLKGEWERGPCGAYHRQCYQTKAIGNQERDCAWGCARGINTTCENLQIEKHKSVRWAERTPSWFVLFDLKIFSGGVYPRSQPHAQTLFLFPIVFGINLIHFFDEKKDGAAGNSIVCFGASIPCHAVWQNRRRLRTVSKSATYLATESVNSAPFMFKRGVRERGANFWQGKVQYSSPILRCALWQGKVQNSSPIFALLGWRHFRPSLSLSLSLCISLSHRAHLTHNIGSASALPHKNLLARLEKRRSEEGTSICLMVYWTMWTQQRNRRKKKPCTDSSIGSCVRACVADARATVYVCVHMPKEVYEKEKMCVHAAGEAGSTAVWEYSSLCRVSQTLFTPRGQARLPLKGQKAFPPLHTKYSTAHPKRVLQVRAVIICCGKICAQTKLSNPTSGCASSARRTRGTLVTTEGMSPWVVCALTWRTHCCVGKQQSASCTKTTGSWCNWRVSWIMWQQMSGDWLSIHMVRTSKTDHFFKLAPFWSPLTDLIDFDMAGKLLTSATRRCSPFVDSVSRIWIKPKKSLIGCWAPTATTFGQSAPSRVQLTAGRNGHNRHFERPSLVSSVCRSLYTGKIELYVSWAAYFRGVLPWLKRTTMKPAGFACTGTISRVIVKVTSSSDLEKIRVRSKSTRRQACRFQQRGLLRTLNKQFWER